MPNTVLEALEKYRQVSSQQEVDNIRSLIKKYLSPQLLIVLGLQSLQSRKIPCILDRMPINGFVAIADPIFQQQLPQVENPDTRKVMKSKWKRFCQWLQEQKWYSSEPIQLEHTPAKSGHAFTHIPKGITYKPGKTGRSVERYGLKKTELTPKLNQQLQDFYRFGQTITRRNPKPNRDLTQEEYQDRILRFFGWLKNIVGFSIADLDLAQMADSSLLKKYEQWHEQRGTASLTIENYIVPCINVAKFLNQDLDDEEWDRAKRPCKNFVNAIPDRKDRPHASDEAYRERVLERQEYEVIISYLEWCCKDLQEQHGVTAKVIDAWMDYLIIALLVTTGVRQREIRELCTKRLVQDFNGLYSVKLVPDDHKTGSETGRGRGYPLFVGPFQKQLCQDLTYYLEHIRPKNLDHDCLFFIRRARTGRNGTRYRGDRILIANNLTGRVPRLIYRVTTHLFGPEKAKRTTCHDFRGITATWVCTYGEPKHFPIYAEMLGHSVDMLTKLYAKINPGDLAAQAPIAYEEIAANQARLAGRAIAHKSTESKSTAQVSTDSEQVEMMRSLLKIMWIALPESKRDDIHNVLTPSQRRLIDI